MIKDFLIVAAGFFQCVGQQRQAVEGAVVATAKGLSNAVVWIAGIKTGKPIPIDKRVELTSEKCAFDPRVQAMMVGSTIGSANSSSWMLLQ